MEHVDQRIFDSYRGAGLDAKTDREVADLLDAKVRESGREGKHVYHLIGTVGREKDGQPAEQLTDEQWSAEARAALRAVGLERCRWIAVNHSSPEDNHVHVIVTLADEGGKRVKRPWNDRYKLRDVAQAAEQKYGLRATPDAGKGNPEVAPTRAEKEKARRAGQRLDAHDREAGAKPHNYTETLSTDRKVAYRAVVRAGEAATSPEDFIARLQRDGCQAEARYDSAGHAQGFKVRAYPSSPWFSGKSLHRNTRSLIRSLESLSRTWEQTRRLQAEANRARAALQMMRLADARVQAAWASCQNQWWARPDASVHLSDEQRLEIGLKEVKRRIAGHEQPLTVARTSTVVDEAPVRTYDCGRDNEMER